MFPLHALSSTEAVVCDPQPGVYNVVFDVKAVNCQYYTNPQRNTKSATPNIDLTPYTQEATADTVTIDLTDADQLLSVGYFIELSGTTRPELAADAYKVTAVDSTGFSFVVPGIGTFASESADGTLLKYYPYLDLRIEDIEYQIELERNIAEPTVDAPVKLRGLSRNWLKDISITKFKTRNCRYFALVEDIDNFKSTHFEHVWDMPTEPWAAQEAVPTSYSQVTSVYVFDIDNCANAEIHGNFVGCSRGVKIANSPNSHISGRFQCTQGRVLEDLGGNDGSTFVGKVAGAIAPIVNGEGTSQFKIIYEDYKRPPVTITGNTNLSMLHWGRDLQVTAAAVLTMPTGLPSDFECAVMRDTASAVSFDMSAVTVKGNTTILNQNGWAAVKGLASNTYAVTGDV
jgi:hypothetical protein